MLGYIEDKKEMIEIISNVLSWPAVCIVALLVLRKPIAQLINRLIQSDSGEAKFGPIEIKLGKVAEEGKKAVTTLNRISMVMAKSRRLKLEIISGGFSGAFTDAQNNEIRQHTKELAELTKRAEQSLAAYGNTATAEG